MRDSQAKLVLFNELRRGPLTAVEASLFPVRMRTEMIREGIARQRDDGGLELANPTTYSGSTPTTIPPPSKSGTMPAVSVPALPTLTARVPQEDLDYLDSLGYPSRSDAARAVMQEVVSRGVGRKRAKAL
jgi:hypothetical protein